MIALTMKRMNLDIHQAYAYVKRKSPWIGPNMSLIYQLTDWNRICKQLKSVRIEPYSRTCAPSTPPSTPKITTSTVTLLSRSASVERGGRHYIDSLQIDSSSSSSSSVSDDTRQRRRQSQPPPGWSASRLRSH